MTYKAVSTKVSHIAHAGLGYTVDRQKKYHSKANGWYIPKHDTVAEDIDGVRLGGYNSSHDSSQNTYTRNWDKSGTSGSGGSTSTGTGGTVLNDAEVIKNKKYYEGMDPSKMTNEELTSYRTRAALEDYYSKGNPSKYDQTISMMNKSQQFIRDGSSFVKSVMPDQQRKRIDLSGMSDEELRARVNRANLERQYNDYFNPPTVNKGKEYVDSFASFAGLALSAGSLGLEVMKTIKSFK